MEHKLLRILVTGATGRQGGTLARILLTRGHRVKAFTRKPDGPEALGLKKLGAEIVEGSFEDPTALERACLDVDAVFAVTTPFEKGAEEEARLGMTIADACRTARVSHLLFTSVGYADRNTGVPFFDSKAKVEKYIRSLGMPYTIIAPVNFMENVLSPWMLPALQEGKYSQPFPPQRRLHHIALLDIARFAALILESPGRFLNKRIDIASDELTMEDLVRVLSQAIGRTIVYEEISLDGVRAMGEDFAKMIEWMDRVGYHIDIPALRRDYPEVGWHTYEEWAKAQDWRNILRAGKKAA